jgi:hypothetical protein
MSARFIDMTKEAFSFLEGAGFRLARVEAGYMRYESSNSVIVITWDSRSGELEAFFELLSSTDQAQGSYSLTDVLRLEGVTHRKMPSQVADENRLKPFLAQLAEDLLAHAEPALMGDRMFFRRLETFRRAQAETFTQGLQLEHIRAEVTQAWRNEEFDKVVRLYSSVEDKLSKAEKARLKYARKQKT